MATSLIAQRYAKAIFELSVEMNVVEDVKSDMELIQSVCSSNKDFIHLLKSPVIRPNKKIIVLEDINVTRKCQAEFEGIWEGTQS